MVVAGVVTRVPERVGRESLCFFGKTVPLFTALRKGKVCTSGLAVRQAEKGVQSGVLVLSEQKLCSGKGGCPLADDGGTGKGSPLPLQCPPTAYWEINSTQIQTFLPNANDERSR